MLFQTQDITGESQVSETTAWYNSPFAGSFFFLNWGIVALHFPGSSEGKASACNAGHPGSIPGSGRSSGAGTGNPLQDSCLENFMDRGAWRATVHGVAESQTQLSD